MRKNRVSRVNESFFKVWREESAYVVGYYMADGHIQLPHGNTRASELRFTSSCKDNLEQIRKVMCSEHTITGGPSHKLQIASQPLVDSLIKMGFGPKLSTRPMKFPDAGKYARHMLRGYFDGDGGICVPTQKKPHVCEMYFCCTDVGHANQLMGMVPGVSLKLHESVLRGGRTRKMYILQVAAWEGCYKLGKLLWDNVKIYDKRKKAIWDNWRVVLEGYIKEHFHRGKGLAAVKKYMEAKGVLR